MTEIKSRLTPSRVLHSHECATLGETAIHAAQNGVSLEGADLKGANLEGADLRGTYLWGTYLQRADLSNANLEGADLSNANLPWAYLQGAYLQRSYLKGANLKGAKLEGAKLKGAKLKGANLKGANLSDGRALGEWQAEPLAGLCAEPLAIERAIAHWGEKSWKRCPMHAAHGWTGYGDAPNNKRLLLAAFVALHDGGHLPRPE